MSNYVIGDVQGCFLELSGLLKSFYFNEKKDKLWFVGDLINRGPDSLLTVEFLHSIRQSCNIVLGNHDLHFLSIAEGLINPNKEDTLDELLASRHLSTYTEWLRNQNILYYEKLESNNGLKTFIMTHAGIPPQWTWKQTRKFSEEIENILKDELSYEEYLRNIYGDYPKKNNSNLKKMEKLRLHTNYFTRMRFCDLKGELDLISGKENGLKAKSSPGFKPWFLHPSKSLKKDFHLFFGHWASLECFTGLNHVTATDSGCVWGNKLSAFRLEDDQVFSYDRLK